MIGAASHYPPIAHSSLQVLVEAAAAHSTHDSACWFWHTR
jgi:hypothetical protein